MNITNFSFGEDKRLTLLGHFGETDIIEKAVGGGKLDTSHLVLKDITTKDGKTAKRWVDPSTGQEHAEHGSKVQFQHNGEDHTGTVGRVSKSNGKYVVKSDKDGAEYKKAHNEITPHKDTNTAHHQLARKKDDGVLQKYVSNPNAHPDYKNAAQDVLDERKNGGKPSTDGQAKTDPKADSNSAKTDSAAKPQPKQDAAKPDSTAKAAPAKQDDDDDDKPQSDKEVAEEIGERFKDFADYVKGVVQGKKKSAIMYGSGGVGKTFTTKMQLEKQFGKNRMFNSETMAPGSDDYDYVFIDGGKVTSTGFWKNMYQHNGKVIVFDDCDSALEDPNIKGYLKGALGSSQSQVTNSSGRAIKDDDGNPIPQQFNFTGKMVFISNLPKDKILDKDMQPVMSRSYSMDMTMSRDQTMAYIKHIATDKKTGKMDNMKFDGLNYDEDEMKHVVSYLDKHKNNAFDLNARTVETLLGVYQLSKERVDEDELESGKTLDAKDKEKEIMRHFDRKAIEYLYQHKMENGKVDKKYIAKSLTDFLGGSTISEIRAWHRMGIFSIKNFFDNHI